MIDLSAVIEEELERILEGFLEDGLEPREYGEMDARIRKWKSELRDVFEAELIEELAMDTYFYLERADLWTSYLKKQVNKQRRQQIIDVLTSWQRPYLLLGQVTDELDNRLIIKDELSEIEYVLPGQVVETHTGEWLFGIVMPDPRFGEFGLSATNGIIFIPGDRLGLVQQLRERMKSSSEMNYLNAYLLFGQIENLFAFPPFQQKVLDLTKQYLVEHEYEEEIVMQLVSTFLLDNEVNAKKPGAIAAGVIQASSDFQLLGSTFTTLKEIGAYFNVSSATVSKYRDKVGDFMLDTISTFDKEDTELLEISSVLEDMGTDPRGTERFMWEMLMRSKHQSFETVEALNAHLSGKWNEEYKPANDAERVQLLCYKAYEAESEELRVQLAYEAAGINSKTTDVQLLLAEQSTHKIAIENHYLKAISYASIDRSIDNAWNNVLNRPYLRSVFTYATWLMTQNRYVDALVQFKDIVDLNPMDHQGARWFITAAYIRLGLYEDAYDVLNQINPDEDDAVSFYLDIVVEKKINNQEVDKVTLKHAEKLNKHVKTMKAQGRKSEAFPRSLWIQPGNEDEAKLICWLVNGLI